MLNKQLMLDHQPTHRLSFEIIFAVAGTIKIKSAHLEREYDPFQPHFYESNKSL